MFPVVGKNTVSQKLAFNTLLRTVPHALMPSLHVWNEHGPSVCPCEETDESLLPGNGRTKQLHTNMRASSCAHHNSVSSALLADRTSGGSNHVLHT
jgi:hypothetical protein